MPGRVWLQADYSQAEVRVVAWAGPVPTLRNLFLRGEDIHLYICQQIARYVQDNHIPMPDVPMQQKDGTFELRTIFKWKDWQDYNADDPERYTSKRTVHANNYGMGRRKFALITKLPEKYAEMVQEVYFHLCPEVKTGYQAWIDGQLRRDRTIKVPQGFRRVFYDAPGPELSRSAYAFYPQTTIGLLLVNTLTECCEVFRKEGIGKDQVIVNSLHPNDIRAGGLDIRLQMHDSVCVALNDDPVEIAYAATIIRDIGERPLLVRNDLLSVPLDFKVGPTLHKNDLKNYTIS